MSASLGDVIGGLVFVAAIGYGSMQACDAFRDRPSGPSGPSFSIPQPSAAGELVVTDSEEGSYTTPLVTCQSGEHTGFFGVDLADAKQRIAARIVRDPVKGFAIIVRSATTDKAGTLTPETCAGLTADVRRTNTTVNMIRLLDGEASLDCALPGRGHVRLQVSFKGCR
jgi:hypothetical protein